ncbi:MAG TPA: ATP-binding protein [Rhodothermales bacterium]
MRLVLGYAALFVASTILLAVLAYALFTHFMREPDRIFMRTQARELADAYARGGTEALRSELLASGSEERREELLVRLAGPDGRTRLLYNPDNWRPSELAHLQRQGPSTSDGWISLGQAEDQDALEAYVLPLSDGSVLQVGMDADLRADALDSIREAFFAIAVPVLVLAVLVGLLMAYRALAPVRRLVATLQTIEATGDLEMRADATGARGEFAELIHLFNRMVGRIERLVNGMRGTLDNVAHDLRTPMTRLRGRAELALRDGHDAGDYRDALAESLEDSDAVLTMLDTMMEVAEAEAGVLQLRLESLRVTDLVEDVVELYQLVADERGVAIQDQVAPDLRLTADRSRIRRVLANLVDNAVKYTPRGGTVTVLATRNRGAVELRVLDDGPGIPETDRFRIWDRLYRGDESRSERGLGLGLSLVKAIVQAHGGDVDAEARAEGGSAFIVRLPDRRDESLS